MKIIILYDRVNTPSAARVAGFAEAPSTAASSKPAAAPMRSSRAANWPRAASCST